MKIEVYPMDYEEFSEATGNNYGLLQQIFDCGTAIGQATNRKLMRDLRIYMAVGGMATGSRSLYQWEKLFGNRYGKKTDYIFV